jgi:predicted small lipoprotein YifL
MRQILLVTAVLLLLAGCGKKGPLYLPDPAQPPASTSTPSK